MIHTTDFYDYKELQFTKCNMQAVLTYRKRFLPNEHYDDMKRGSPEKKSRLSPDARFEAIYEVLRFPRDLIKLIHEYDVPPCPFLKELHQLVPRMEDAKDSDWVYNRDFDVQGFLVLSSERLGINLFEYFKANIRSVCVIRVPVGYVVHAPDGNRIRWRGTPGVKKKGRTAAEAQKQALHRQLAQLKCDFPEWESEDESESESDNDD